MNLSRFLDEKCIILDVQSRNHLESLGEIMNSIPHNGQLRNKDRALKELLERECLSSTGIGGGFAIPHVFTEEANLPTLIFARSRSGIDFDAKDGKPVYVLVIAFANPRKKNFFIQCLYHVVQLLRDPEVFKRLKNAENKETVLKLFGQKRAKVKQEQLQPISKPVEGKSGSLAYNSQIILSSIAKMAAEVSA